MGYYTYYTMDMDEKGERAKEILQYMIKEFKENDMFYPFEDCVEEWLDKEITTNVDLKPYDTAKWYDHEEDMAELSRTFPEVLFTLYGDGEESEDMWYKYFKGGKMQKCYAKIVFDDYDESKLEEI